MPLVLPRWAPHPQVSGRSLIGRLPADSEVVVLAAVLLSGFSGRRVLGSSVGRFQPSPVDLYSVLLIVGADVWASELVMCLHCQRIVP
jgi:hypothetical protein